MTVPDNSNIDIDYKPIRDFPDNKPYRAFVEYLWTRYQPSGDGDAFFLTEAKRHFRQRFWEMYLFCSLEDRRLKVHKTTGRGPDFFLEVAGKKYWVEAIAPEAGIKMAKCHFLLTMCQENLSFCATLSVITLS